MGGRSGSGPGGIGVRAALYNSRLTVKNIAGLEFGEGGIRYGSDKPFYAAFVEGKGFVKFKEGGIFGSNKKGTAEEMIKEGLTSYKNVQFVNPKGLSQTGKQNINNAKQFGGRKGITHLVGKTGSPRYNPRYSESLYSDKLTKLANSVSNARRKGDASAEKKAKDAFKKAWNQAYGKPKDANTYDWGIKDVLGIGPGY